MSRSVPRIRAHRRRAPAIAAAAALLALALLARPLAAQPPVQAAPVEAGGLRARVEAFVRERAPAPPLRIELPALAALEPAPGAELRMAVHPDTRWSGSVPITLVYLERGREVRRETVTAQVELAVRAWVAARRLRRGDDVRAEDVREVELSSRQLPQGALLDASAAIGKRAARAVPEGAVWRAAWLETAHLVRRGDLVPLVFMAGGLRIEARGRALEDGSAGAVIRVQNADSRRELAGRVAADGAVHVEP
jgi:flagella basal body P-ring formation protein FlgA